MTGGGQPESDGRPNVLAVDDEERVVQAFQIWLDEEFEVETATSGTAAIEKMHEDIDVVLLDRHMPDMPGDEVLEHIRDERYDCRVAMVTAVAPDFDIVDMPFDHYISKPVDEPTLRNVVNRLLSLDAYDGRLNELYGIRQTIATLETEKTNSQLANHNQYQSLLDRQETLQEEAQQFISEMDDDEVESVFELVDSGRP